MVGPRVVEWAKGCTLNITTQLLCPPPTLLATLVQHCNEDWAMRCNPSDACCLPPASLVSASPPAATLCGGRSTGANVCDLRSECYTTWVAWG